MKLTKTEDFLMKKSQKNCRESIRKYKVACNMLQTLEIPRKIDSGTYSLS